MTICSAVRGRAATGLLPKLAGTIFPAPAPPHRRSPDRRATPDVSNRAPGASGELVRMNRFEFPSAPPAPALRARVLRQLGGMPAGVTLLVRLEPPSSGNAAEDLPAPSTGAAPSRIRRLVPAETGLVMLPGTAMTSLPWSSAAPAVISAPDPTAASTTTVTRQRPLMSRLRRGKLPTRGRSPGGNSLSSRPSRGHPIV